MKPITIPEVSITLHDAVCRAFCEEPQPEWPPRIHYPRPPRPQHNHAPDPEGKNFEWFVGNKSGGKGKGEKKGPFHALPSAVEMGKGLSLIDKDGVEYKP